MKLPATIFLSLCMSASRVAPEGGFYNSMAGTLSRVKNGLVYYMPKLGSCPNMPAQKNFADDIDDLLGTWHVQYALGHEVLQGNARDMSANVQYDYGTKQLSINLHQLNMVTRKWSGLVASAQLFNNSLNEFKFRASFNTTLYGPVGGTYTLVKTDFNKYGVVHGCGNFWNLLYYDIIWLVSREQALTLEEREEFDRLTRAVLAGLPFVDSTKFKKILQANTAEDD